MKIAELNVYPLKSGRRIALQEAVLALEGLSGDRRMMLVDPTGQFITQRQLQPLAQLRASVTDSGARFAMDGKAELIVGQPPAGRRFDVQVWKAPVSAALADDQSNNTLSQWLGRDVRLVFFDDIAKRHASPDWAGPDSAITFSDGFPLLITTTGSLDGLNADMLAHNEGAVTMDRFRPNIVIEHDKPFADDSWDAIEIAGIRFDYVKPCTRCIMTTQDQLTGSRDVPSPMGAMRRIRMSGDRRAAGTLFGWNAVPRDEGRLKVGDSVRVIGERTPWPLEPRTDLGSDTA